MESAGIWPWISKTCRSLRDLSGYRVNQELGDRLQEVALSHDFDFVLAYN